MNRREFLSGFAAASAEGTGALSIVVPPDGGTPRDPKRVVRLGPREFRILATAEEGNTGVEHAVVRVDLIVRNAGPETDIVLHIDLSCDGTRTNFDSNQYGRMPQRDYVYVQRPGERWRRIDGATAGWVATVRFSVPSGETKIGLSPWYTYGDYLAYVASLRHPHFEKAMIGKSDAGREHWELTITDPSVPARNKQRILWHVREHAFETFSSFAVEGLVEYLLSPAAAEHRRRFALSIHPMVNVDGVANGYEYRGGYDYPDRRAAATGRLAWAAIDRLRPDVVVAWHNWVAPRDLDVVFYTHGEEGRASRRAWDLFTQRFPSPRSVGHRWDSESNPDAKNWFGRKLSDNNVHQYAMKHYGTRVWGWEMPWWGRDDGEPLQNARIKGAEFGRAFLGTLIELEKPAAPFEDRPPVEVPCGEMHEFEVRGPSHVENPFRDAALIGEFQSPSGKKVSVEGFCYGGDLWKLRFVPEEQGEGTYLLRGEGASLFARGRLVATAPRGQASIRVHREHVV